MSFSALSKFVQENAWVSSLLGVIIGGVITVITTNFIERGKEKREMSRSKLEKELIPYCSDLEAVIKRVEQIIQLSKSENYESCYTVFSRIPERQEIIETLLKPTSHLDAAKRVYLPKAQRKELEEYDREIRSFDDRWDHDCDSIKDSFESWMEKSLEGFTLGYGKLEHSYCFNKAFEMHLDKCLLAKKSFNPFDDLHFITFFEEPDGESHTFSLDIFLNRDIVEKHDRGDEVPNDVDEQTSFDLLDHLDGKRWDGMKAELEKSTIKEDLYNILLSLKRMQKDMTKTIDHIV